MKNNKNIITIVVIAALVVGVYMYSQGSIPGLPGGSTADRGNNGYWNAEAQQCWTTPNNLQGGVKPFYSCCFDQKGYQVDCSDATKKLSANPEVFAVYFPSGGTSTPGIYSAAHTLTISNAKNTAFTKVWIEPVTWSSTLSPATPTWAAQATAVSAVNTKWATMTGSSNTMAGPIDKSGGASPSRAFAMTGTIDLQTLSPSKDQAVTYTASVVTKGTYLVDGVSTTFTAPTETAAFTVTKEEVGFSVSISYGG